MWDCEEVERIRAALVRMVQELEHDGYKQLAEKLVEALDVIDFATAERMK